MRFNRIVQWLVCLAALAFSATALAQAWIGAELGSADAKDFCKERGSSCDKTGTPWRVFGGAYVTPNFGIEAGFIDLSRMTATDTASDTKLESRAGELLGLIAFRARQASIFAKAGGYYALTKLTVVSSGLTTRTTENNAGLVYGAGAQVNFTPNFGVRGDWHRYAKVGNASTGGETDINTFLLGVVWNFR
jgi:OOP family OmpA-OmpF porin